MMLWSPPSCTAVVRHSSADSASSRMGAPVSGPGCQATPASWSASGRPRVASQRDSFSASSSSTLTAHLPAASTASWNRAIFSAQNSTSSGSSDTEVNALTVMLCGTPSRVAETTRMPVANCPAARRKSAGSTSGLGSGSPATGLAAVM
jgi:hypothetical protein